MLHKSRDNPGMLSVNTKPAEGDWRAIFAINFPLTASYS